MGEIFSAIGSIWAADIQADAVEDAAFEQARALREQREFLYNELEPDKLKQQALRADVERALEQRKLQEQISPGLAETRRVAEARILEGISGMGAESTAARVGEQAAREALAGVPRMDEAKARLVDAALAELDAGATLPSDVQAEFVKAGLEQTGQVTGQASARGVGGTILRRLLGTEGIKLQQQRQAQAAALLGQAQQLEASRQQLLGTLFPNLSAVQIGQTGAVSNVLGQVEGLAPEAGLTGEDVTNLWLQRVGAGGQLARAAAEAIGAGGLGAAQAFGGGLGTAIGYGGSALPSTQSVWNSIFNRKPTGVGSGPGTFSTEADYLKAIG